MVWGLKDGGLYQKEAAIFAAIWCVFLAGFIVLPQFAIGFIIASVLVDIVLLFKVVGQDVLAS